MEEREAVPRGMAWTRWGQGMASLIYYEFVQTDKDSLGFVGVDRVKQLKRDVRKAWEDKGLRIQLPGM